jgi:hypothetical protein
VTAISAFALANGYASGYAPGEHLDNRMPAPAVDRGFPDEGLRRRPRELHRHSPDDQPIRPSGKHTTRQLTGLAAGKVPGGRPQPTSSVGDCCLTGDYWAHFDFYTLIALKPCLDANPPPLVLFASGHFQGSAHESTRIAL